MNRTFNLFILTLVDMVFFILLFILLCVKQHYYTIIAVIAIAILFKIAIQSFMLPSNDFRTFQDLEYQSINV